ncbi:MAG: hypothetical protein J6T67_05925 [Paludibacteraceae bacterium]|nr:hypothetical protein [Paludibacteraceae bacterium]
MARQCKARVKFGGTDHFHIFLNSVRGISKIIGYAGLQPEDCRIVCSQSSEDAQLRNQRTLPRGFSIGSTIDPVRLFNFYTSTCFEGCDILDEDGRIFIVSEKYKDHTMLDIQTSLLQICGRIRNSKYKLEITQLYGTSVYKDVTLEEFMANLNAEVAAAEINAKAYDQTVGAERERLINNHLTKSHYIGVDGDGRIVLDRTFANIEIVNYNIVNGVYRSQVNMVSALKSADLNVIASSEEDAPDEELEELKSIERTPFKEIFEEYCRLKERSGLYDLSFRESRIALEKPLVVEAYKKLGPEKVREMNYHISNIKRELVKVKHETLDVKVFLLIDPLLEKGVAITRAQIKAILQKAYDDLGVTERAAASHLNR